MTTVHQLIVFTTKTCGQHLEGQSLANVSHFQMIDHLYCLYEFHLNSVVSPRVDLNSRYWWLLICQLTERL